MVAVATVSNPIECFLILLTNTEIQMSVLLFVLMLLNLEQRKIFHFCNLQVSSPEAEGGGVSRLLKGPSMKYMNAFYMVFTLK